MTTDSLKLMRPSVALNASPILIKSTTPVSPSRRNCFNVNTDMNNNDEGKLCKAFINCKSASFIKTELENALMNYTEINELLCKIKNLLRTLIDANQDICNKKNVFKEKVILILTYVI